MDDLQAFLAAIDAAPDDDTIRLVFADWLQEHDDDKWADFIRIQCGRNVPGQSEGSLLASNRARWLTEFEGALDWPGAKVRFVRGFPEEIHVENWERFRPKLHAKRNWPNWVRTLCLFNFDLDRESVVDLTLSPQLAGLSSLLVLSTHIGPEEAGILAACPYLAGLSKLYLSCNAIGDEGAAALAASPSLAGLIKLDIGFNAIGDVGAAALASSPYLVHMLDLYIGGNFKMSDEGIRLLHERFGNRFRI